jgi:hypothetical protein
MSNTYQDLLSEDNRKGPADTSKSAWQRPALRRLAANQADTHHPTMNNSEHLSAPMHSS